ncbi:MAG: rhomboid family intramembrane serine protease [Lachnospiraceae bacterium]|nr:rhomboid family intramembrane serine protease [Lachnospiraceae bacterium]
MEEELDRGYNPYIVTILLCVINILLYIYSVYCMEDAYIFGGINYHMVLEQKEYYRFLTSIYLHGDISHIAMNMLALAVSGSLVESYLGSLKTAIIYFISGFGGSVLSLLFHNPEENVYSIGASGAIFGLMVAAALIQNKKEGKSLIKAVVFVMIYALGTWSQGIDLLGHIGGALAGSVASVIACVHFEEDYKENVIKKVIGAVIALGISGIACLLIFT